MSCREEHRELISAYVDGELEPAEEKFVSEHLEKCEACRAYHDKLLAAVDSIGKLHQPSTSSERRATLKIRLAREARREMRTRALVKSLALTGAAAAVLVFIIGILVNNLPEDRVMREVVEDTPPSYTGEIIFPVQQPEPPDVTGKDDDENRPGKNDKTPPGGTGIASKPPETGTGAAVKPGPDETGLVVKTPDDKKPEPGATKREPEKKDIVAKTTVLELKKQYAAAETEFNLALAAKNVRAQMKAVSKLAFIDIPETYEMIRGIITNAAKKYAGLVRREAVIALGKLGTGEAAEALFMAADDSSCMVACRVPFALVEAKSPGAAEVYIRTLRAEKDAYKRMLAAEALGACGGEGAADALKRAVETDPALDVRLSAVAALGRVGHDTKYFGKLIQDNKRGNGRGLLFRQAAVRALGYSSDFEAHRLLGKVFREDRSALVREEAARAIRRAHTFEASDELEKMVRNASPSSRLYGEVRRTYAELMNEPDAGKKPGFGFNGISCQARRVLFVIDVSYSMTGPEKTKWIRENIASALRSMKGDQQFNIMLFSKNVQLVYKKPVTASKKNVERAVRGLNSRLMTSYANFPDLQKAFASILKTNADTVFIITEGFKSHRGRQSAVEIVRSVSRANRLGSQMTIHTTGLFTYPGRRLPSKEPRPVGEEVDLLRNVARENGGTFKYMWFERNRIKSKK